MKKHVFRRVVKYTIDEEVEVLLDEKYLPIKHFGEDTIFFFLLALDKVKNRKVVIRVFKGLFKKGRRILLGVLKDLMLRRHVDSENIFRIVEVNIPGDLGSMEDLYVVHEHFESNLKEYMDEKGISGSKMDEESVKSIIYGLLKGLRYIHDCGVVHRRVFPGAVRIDRNMRVVLDDLFYSFESGSDEGNDAFPMRRWYRSPEMLLGWKNVIPARDIWGVGLIFAELLSDDLKEEERVMFRGIDWFNQIRIIVRFLGTPNDESEIHGSARGKSFVKNHLQNLLKKDFRTCRFPNASEEALDLLEKMLLFEPLKRITAAEALKHKFFESVRMRENNDDDDEENGNKLLTEFFTQKIKNRVQSENIRTLFLEEVKYWKAQELKFDEIRRDLEQRISFLKGEWDNTDDDDGRRKNMFMLKIGDSCTFLLNPFMLEM